jgi:hypothetical protein
MQLVKWEMEESGFGSTSGSGSSQYFYDTFAYGTYVYRKYFNALLIYETHIYAPYFYKTLLKNRAQYSLFSAADLWVHTSTAVEIKRKFYFNFVLYFYVEVLRD